MSETLLDHIKADSQIDAKDLEAELIKIPLLMRKYWSHARRVTAALDKKELELNSKFNELFMYYTGQARGDIYRKNPLRKELAGTTAKIQCESLLLEDHIELRQLKADLALVEEMLKSIKDRQYIIRNIIDYRRFNLTQ